MFNTAASGFNSLQSQIVGKSAHHRFPGAALLTLNFTPKDILHEGKSKVVVSEVVSF